MTISDPQPVYLVDASGHRYAAAAGVSGQVIYGAKPVVLIDNNGTPYDLTSLGGGSTADATTSSKGVVQLAGDLAGTAASPALAAVGSAAGPIGSATAVPVVTTDTKGRVTALTSTTIQIPESQVTNLTTDLAAKAPTASPTFTGTVSGVTASMVGLGNVTNTSDANKPVSTAQAAAILASPRPLASAVPIGWQFSPPFSSGGTGTPTSGDWNFFPFWTANQSMTIDLLKVNVSTAQVGGTVSFAIGVYPDDGTGLPNGAAQVGNTSSFTLTATGSQSSSFATPIVLTPGAYWLCVMYIASVAPTTVPIFTTMNAMSAALPTPNSTAPGTIVHSYRIGSQSALPSATISSASLIANGSATYPVVALHRSA